MWHWVCSPVLQEGKGKDGIKLWPKIEASFLTVLFENFLSQEWFLDKGRIGMWPTLVEVKMDRVSKSTKKVNYTQ